MSVGNTPDPESGAQTPVLGKEKEWGILFCSPKMYKNFPTAMQISITFQDFNTPYPRFRGGKERESLFSYSENVLKLSYTAMQNSQIFPGVIHSFTFFIVFIFPIPLLLIVKIALVAVVLYSYDDLQIVFWNWIELNWIELAYSSLQVEAPPYSPPKKISIFCFSHAANIYIRFICKQTLKK